MRLREELQGLEVPIDLVLVTERHVEEWGHFEGTMLNEALREGRVLAQAAVMAIRELPQSRIVTTWRWIDLRRGRGGGTRPHRLIASTFDFHAVADIEVELSHASHPERQ